MQAIVSRSYGPPDVLELVDLDTPTVGEVDVLVRVHAASINPLDWHFCTGTPYLLRLVAGLRAPKTEVRGVDLAGVVEAVGSAVTSVQVGDRIVANVARAFAEHVATAATNVVKIPDEMTFADAAALPVAAVTALQGLRDHGKVQPGQSLLINGAAGGVGTFAVQIAKSMGATVTGVCSSRNVDMVRELGADDVVDYAKTSLLDIGRRFDVVLDNVGNHPGRAVRKLLTDDGVYVLTSGPKERKLLGPIANMVAGRVAFLGRSQRFASFTAAESAKELSELLGMMQRGEMRPVIDRHYPLEETVEAMRYIETGHARAKVIIDIADRQGEPAAVDRPI